MRLAYLPRLARLLSSPPCARAPRRTVLIVTVGFVAFSEAADATRLTSLFIGLVFGSGSFVCHL